MAKTYRLLRAILATAADDGMIRRNPCRIKGASQETSPERPVLTIAQVYALAEAIGQRYRAMILLAVFASLRWGELAADTGARLRELMNRMGHATSRAALIYLHSKDERQQAIADAISQRTTSELREDTPRSSTQHFLRMR